MHMPHKKISTQLIKNIVTHVITNPIMESMLIVYSSLIAAAEQPEKIKTHPPQNGQ